MTFDPNYVPEKVDFLVAYNTFNKTVYHYDGYRKLCQELGMDFQERIILEDLLLPGSSLLKLTKDTITVMHGNMCASQNNGIDQAIEISKIHDSRFLVSFDPDMLDMDHLKEYRAKGIDFNCLTPKSQVSFFAIDISGEFIEQICKPDGFMRTYFEELAGLKGDGGRKDV